MTGAIERYRDGAAAGVGEVVAAYARPAFAAAMSVLGDRAAAERIVTEALAAALDDAAQFNPREQNEAAWLLARVRAHAIRAHRRSRASERRRPVEIEPDPVWRGIMAQANGERVRAALDHLGEAQRETVALAFWKGLRPVEIAKLRGVSEEIVRENLRTGLERVRDALARTAREGSAL